jgi:hypothetical protein
MKLFATALKAAPFEKEDTEVFELVAKLQSEYELKLAFNHSHDDLGRFTSHDKAVSSSGGHDTTRSTSYGVSGTKQRAMTAPKTSAGGKRESAIHREAATSQTEEDKKHKAPVVREVNDAIYQSRDGEGKKKAQAVKVARKIVAGREKTNRLDYDGSAHVSAETAHHLLTGLKTGKSTTVFQSHALDKNADQKHRQITQHIDKKAFKNIDALHNSLESHGLGDAIVHKTEDGYRVMHSMNNGANKDNTNAGRAKQRRVMEFRRSVNPAHMNTDHHAGSRTTYSTQKQHAELSKFAAANPTHATSLAYKAHIGA